MTTKFIAVEKLQELVDAWRLRGVKGGSSDVCADELQSILSQAVEVGSTESVCGYTDGGRNPHYEGLFDEETYHQRDDRLKAAEYSEAIENVIAAAISLIKDAEEFETSDGLMNAAQLHLWHALEDAIEKVGPANRYFP